MNLTRAQELLAGEQENTYIIRFSRFAILFTTLMLRQIPDVLSIRQEVFEKV